MSISLEHSAYLGIPRVPTIVNAIDWGSTLFPLDNVISGERRAGYFSSTTGLVSPVTWYYVFDYGAAGIAPDYLYIPISDFSLLDSMDASPLFTFINLYSSPDNSTFTLEESIEVDPLSDPIVPYRTGRANQDRFMQFSGLPTERYWKIEIIGQPYLFFSKLYLGQLFDFGANFQIDSNHQIQNNLQPLVTNDGCPIMIRGNSYNSLTTLIWKGIAD